MSASAAAKTRPHRLGDLQLEIMKTLWQRGEATVTEVHGDLQAERGLAPTTIATMLSKMEKKGIVAHRTEGRRYVYRPEVSEDAVRRGMVAEIRDRLFQGDPVALVSHLLEEHEVDPDEIEELKNLIAQREESHS
jgi:BlaI family penicillinase repressor